MKFYFIVYLYVRDCEVFDFVLIILKIVIDVVGILDLDRG